MWNNVWVGQAKRELMDTVKTLLIPYQWNRGDFRFPRRLSLCLMDTVKTLFVPYQWNRGDFRFLAVCHSVCPSVCLSVRPVRLSVHSVSVHSVFRTFLSRPFRYWLEIWYVNSSLYSTDQVWVSSCLTYFYRSYCPLLKFSFPGFSLPSFEILTWNLVYEFVLT